MKSPGDVCASQGVTNLEKVGCMSNLSVFDFNRNPVRVVVRDGEPWFVAKDLCQILEIRNTSAALSRLDDDEKAIAPTPTPGGKQSVSIVSESGAYALIMSSRKPGIDKLRKLMSDQIKGSRFILEALKDFEVPDDIGEMYVYAIKESETGRIKLGISRDPYARLKQMQTGNSQRLELVAYRKATNRFQDESAIHAKNAQHRIRGEWFSESATL